MQSELPFLLFYPAVNYFYAMNKEIKNNKLNTLQAGYTTLLMALLVIGALFSSGCKKDSSKLKSDFYMQAKADGTLFTFQTDAPGYMEGNSDVGTLFNVGNIEAGLIDIEFGTPPTASDIKALEGTNLSFDNSGAKYVTLQYSNASGDYISGNGIAQTGSNFHVSKVKSNGFYMNLRSYLVEGTFNCAVSNSTTTINLTEGKFAIRVVEL